MIPPVPWKQAAAALGALGLGAWGAVVLWFFLDHLQPLWGPSAASLKTLALALLSLYAFCFLGWRLGRRLFPWLDEETDALERSLLELAIGVAVIAAALFLAGAVGLYSRPLGWVILGLSLGGRHHLFIAEQRRRWGRFRGGRPSPAAAVILLFAGAMTLVASLAPAVSQDSLVYHLAVPARYLETGRLQHVEGNFFSAFPQNVEMLFLLGLMLEGDSLAQWYHWMLGAASALAVAALSRRIAGAAAGGAALARPLFAAAVFATLPTAALIAGWAYIDLGVVFFSTLSLNFFLRFWRRQHRCDLAGLSHRAHGLLFIAAALAALAAGCKYTGGTQGLLLAVMVLVIGRLERRRAAQAALQVGLVSAVVLAGIAPWLIKNWAATGNPFYPFAHFFFPGRDWDGERAAVLARALGEWGGSRSGWDLLALPWEVSVSGQFFSQEGFDGVIGCAFLLGLPLLLWGLRLSEEYRLAALFAFLHGLFWMAMTHQVRFLLPALGLAAALLGAALGALPPGWRRPAALVLHGALAFNVLLIAVHFASHNPLSAVLGLESRHAYLERELPGGDYAVFLHIERSLPAESRILFGSCGNPGFLCKRPYHADALFENATLAMLLAEAREPEALRKRFEAEGFTHLLFRFDTVFDPAGVRSEIPERDQHLLAEFLNRHARLEIEAGGTFLYALRQAESPPGGGDR
jgi:hypothetical protein